MTTNSPIPFVSMFSLLPCAHCGAGAYFGICNDEQDRENFGGEFIECQNAQCGMSTPLMFACMDEVKTKLAEIWNNRINTQLYDPEDDE